MCSTMEARATHQAEDQEEGERERREGGRGGRAGEEVVCQGSNGVCGRGHTGGGW